jgi:sugar lactone lactonase YvrE
MKKNLLPFFVITCALSLSLLPSSDSQAQIINTIAGANSDGGFFGDGGLAINALLNLPDGVAVDDSGNVYISDLNNYRIREITASTGIINTIAGGSLGGFSGDGGLAINAKLNGVGGIALDKNGNIYFADANNNRVREIIKKTGIINTIAGDSVAGYFGDGVPAVSTSLFVPTGIALDTSGNIYIADFGNSRVREVTAKTGIIKTVAGSKNSGYTGDGGLATDAELDDPAGVALDDSGNIYISDNTNNRIRKVTLATGIINTIAGNGKMGFSGDNGIADSAEMNYPYGLEVDHSGNVFFTDVGNNRIREINQSTGIISTFAGGGTNGLGDGGPADSAALSGPTAVGFDLSGNLYIADEQFMRVRKVTINTTGVNNINPYLSLSIYPNPSNGIFNVETPQLKEAKWNLYDLTGRLISSGVVSGLKKFQFNFSALTSGEYFLKIYSSQFTIAKKITIVK